MAEGSMSHTPHLFKDPIVWSNAVTFWFFPGTNKRLSCHILGFLSRAAFLRVSLLFGVSFTIWIGWEFPKSSFWLNNSSLNLSFFLSHFTKAVRRTQAAPLILRLKISSAKIQIHCLKVLPSTKHWSIIQQVLCHFIRRTFLSVFKTLFLIFVWDLSSLGGVGFENLHFYLWTSFL